MGLHPVEAKISRKAAATADGLPATRPPDTWLVDSSSARLRTDHEMPAASPAASGRCSAQKPRRTPPVDCTNLRPGRSPKGHQLFIERRQNGDNRLLGSSVRGQADTVERATSPVCKSERRSRGPVALRQAQDTAGASVYCFSHTPSGGPTSHPGQSLCRPGQKHLDIAAGNQQCRAIAGSQS